MSAAANDRAKLVPPRLVTPTGEPIMTAKLRVPGRQPWTVVRQRLLDRLSLGVAGPLTLITGPAGSGKTTLAASWAAAGRAPGPLVWITLDEQDNQPGVLWSYVLAGLARAGVPVGQVGTPTRPDGVERSLLIRLAASLSEQPGPVVLVLEDTQALTGPQVLSGVDFVLRHAGPQLRVVVIGRQEPALPMHRYRVAGSAVDIRLDDLAFTVPEAGEMLAAHGIRLPEPDLAALVERTRGWAAGLRLAARSQADGAPASASASVAGAVPADIAGYFVAEVLDAQPPEVREFLLRTSVVDRIWPGLAAKLSGHREAPRTLATLAYNEVFVTPDGAEPVGYAYHPIVRDLLRSQLRRETPPNRVAQLHRKAAHWLAGAGRVTDAIAHAAAAGDWEQAAAMVVDGLAIGRLITAPPGDRLAATLRHIPPDLADPAVAVVQAALALTGRDCGLCAKHILRAAELVGDGPADGDEALRLSAAMTEAACALVRGETASALAAVAAAEAGLADRLERDRPVPPDLPALLLLTKGRALLHRGDVEGAAAALSIGAATAEAPGGEHLRPELLGRLALLEAFRGHLRRAADHALRARAAVPDGPAGRVAAADVALAWASVERHDLKAARDHAERAAAAKVRDDPVTAGLWAVAQARLMRARGAAGGAAATVGHTRATGSRSMPRWLLEKLWAVETTVRATSGATETPVAALPAGAEPQSPPAALALATVRLAHGATAEAADRVYRVLSRDDVTVDVRVDAWLLAATCELARDQPRLARSALGRGLALAEGEQLRRPVVEAFPRLRRFLRQERDLVARHAWLEVVAGLPGHADASGTPAGRAAAQPARDATPMVEALTVKETEVLRHLAALLSTEEIALRMFVSVNTVKTHVRGVLRKLAASRRNEAVRRARELGLV